MIANNSPNRRNATNTVKIPAEIILLTDLCDEVGQQRIAAGMANKPNEISFKDIGNVEPK